jgi:hypothetical protein
LKRAVLVLLLVMLAAPVAATGDRAVSAKPEGTVLAIQESRRGDFLVRLDARTLRPVSRRLSLSGHTFAWSFSPDGRRLALGVDRLRGVRIVDPRRMKQIGQIPTWSGGIHTLAWVAPRRIIGWEGAGLFALDPIARKRLPSPATPGDVLLVQRAGNRLLLLTGPAQEIGSARLHVVGADGAVRTVTLEGIRAGIRFQHESEPGESWRPGLAVDSGGRALVIGADGESVAVVDLRSMSATYHRLERRRSLLKRLHNWLEPTAEAKMPLAGSFRSALWLGDDKVAVWGYDAVRAGSGRVDTSPAGLSIVDMPAWTIRTVDAKAWQVAFCGGTLLASHNGDGLTAYSAEGERRYHAFDEENVAAVATFGSKAFVASNRHPIRVIDAATGRLQGTRRGVPRLLHPDFSWW